MKRALVLGASALIILALNQNTVSEVKIQKEGCVCSWYGSCFSIFSIITVRQLPQTFSLFDLFLHVPVHVHDPDASYRLKVKLQVILQVPLECQHPHASLCQDARHKNACIYNNSSNVHILLETDLRFRSSEVPKRQRWQQHKRMSLQKLFWISSWIPQEEWNWEDHLRAAPTVPMSVTQLPFSFPCPHILLPPSRHLSGEARLIQPHH